MSHEEVIEVLKKWFPLLAVTSGVLGAAFCARYFGEVYADNPVYRSVLFVTYGYFACLAIFGGMAKYCDFSNRFTRWMSKRSFGLYVFHYLGISSVALFVARRGTLPALAVSLEFDCRICWRLSFEWNYIKNSGLQVGGAWYQRGEEKCSRIILFKCGR